MNFKRAISVGGIVVLGAPVVTFAQSGSNFEPLLEVVWTIQRVVNLLIPIAVSLALLYFIWGLAKFILKSGSPDARDEGRNKMIWGILALFVITSVWGIVGLLAKIFGVDGPNQQPAPEPVPDPSPLP